MSLKTDYTEEEWLLLMTLPILVGGAVMAAGKSGLGTFKESYTLAQALAAAKADYPTNELIQAVLGSIEAESDMSSFVSESLGVVNIQDYGPLVDEKCRVVAEMLSEKAAPDEATDYRNWVVALGWSVARASKEGGFLGIGGTRVSESEQLVLDQITAAIGASTSESF